MTNPDAPTGPPDYAEAARVLLGLVEEIRSEEEGTLTAPPAVRYRLEGAALALTAVAKGGRLSADDLLSELGFT